MKNCDLFAFGHMCIDIIKTPTEEYEMISGPILFSVWTAHQLGYSVGVLTKAAPEDRRLLEVFPVSGEDLICRDSSETVLSKMEYGTETMEKRVITNLKQADAYSISDFPDFSAKIIHYCGLFRGEVDPEIIRHLSRIAPLAVDVQGLVRKVFEDGSVQYVPWEDKLEVLPYCRFLKADAAEAAFITGIDTENHQGRVEAARQFVEWGAEEVVISHNEELVAYDGDRAVSAFLKNRNHSGRTGRGDTCFASYTTERFSKESAEAIQFAAGLTSLKLETPGPFKRSRKDVDQFILEFY